MRIHGEGPLLCSTSVEMVQWCPSDANGYYRELGFSRPYRPTKAELRQAYVDHDGPNSIRLTYIFKMLIDPVRRRQYDLTPPGEVFMDELVSEMLTARARQHAVSRGIPVQKVLDDMDLVSLTPEEQRELDELVKTRQETGPSYLDPSRDTISWPWSFYSDDSYRRDVERLAIWQQMVLKYLDVPYFAVGYTAYGAPGWIEQVEDDVVVFLRDDSTPSDAIEYLISAGTHHIK